MTYIAFKGFKKKSISGNTDIKKGESLEEKNKMLYYNKKPICFTTSENGHNFFARNNDGNGLLRGELTQQILQAMPTLEDETLDKMFEDNICMKYKRGASEEDWHWNNEFYEASILELRHIATVMGLNNSK